MNTQAVKQVVAQGIRTLRMVPSNVADLARKIEPERFGYSPKMTNLVQAMIGYDYGARDERGNEWISLSITSDGFVQAATMPISSGAFIGSVEDLNRNVKSLLADAKLNDQENTLFWSLYRRHVSDWRPGHGEV